MLHAESGAIWKLRNGCDAAVDVVAAPGIVHVHVDQLRAERTAERRRLIAVLDAEDDVGAIVEDLEALHVPCVGLEVAEARVGVVARTVVVAMFASVFERGRRPGCRPRWFR